MFPAAASRLVGRRAFIAGASTRGRGRHQLPECLSALTRGFAASAPSLGANDSSSSSSNNPRPPSFPSRSGKDGVRRPRSPEARKPVFERFHPLGLPGQLGSGSGSETTEDGSLSPSPSSPSPSSSPSSGATNKQASSAANYSSTSRQTKVADDATVSSSSSSSSLASFATATPGNLPLIRGSKKVKGVRSVKPEPAPAPPSPATAAAAVGFDVERTRATAFCTAEKYDFDVLKPLLEKHYVLNPYLAEDVFHVKLVSRNEEDWLKLVGAESSLGSSATSSSGASLSSSSPSGEGAFISPAEAFIFDNGSFVTWGATVQQQQQMKAILKQAEFNGYDFEETEWFEYIRDPSQPSDLVSDIIVLGNELPLPQAELGFSSGMSRSVKLATLEELLEQFLNSNRHIPEVLRTGKPLRLSRGEVLKQLGTLLSFRGTVNIHAELLDDPDFLWSNKDMEDCFDKVSRNLDIRRRITTFNKKLDYANELAAFLSDHLNQRHGTKLEWIIIWLIAVEVLSEFLHYAERLGWISLDPFARKGNGDDEIGTESSGGHHHHGGEVAPSVANVVVGWRKNN